MQEFDLRKQTILKKLESADKSKQGHIDEEIKDLVTAINEKKDFYSTSSCAGRILLLFRPKTRKKYDVVWIFKSHKESKFKDIQKSLKDFLQKNKRKGIIYFKQEPMIIHIASRDLEKAHSLFDVANQASFRRKGIISVKKRIITEITSSQLLEFPIGDNNEIHCSDNFLNWILNKANENIKHNASMIKNLENGIKTI